MTQATAGGLTLITATHQDAPAIVQIIVDAWPEDSGKPLAAITAEITRQVNASAHGEPFISGAQAIEPNTGFTNLAAAKYGGEVVGFYYWQLTQMHAFVNAVAVAPAHQGMGHFRRMTDAGRAMLYEQLGVEGVIMKARPDAAAVQALIDSGEFTEMYAFVGGTRSAAHNRATFDAKLRPERQHTTLVQPSAQSA